MRVDGDGIGDVCDPDLDGDQFDNVADNCPNIANPLQENLDGDSQGDACDPDADGDLVINLFDVDDFNPLICTDSDEDGCDDCSGGQSMPMPAQDGPDQDGDGICDSGDSAPNDPAVQ